MNEKIAAFSKGPAHPYVCLTAYTASMAAIMAPHVDLILVGDSVAMVVYAAENTLEADLEMMIRHGRAVRRGAPHSLLVVDMPEGSYESDRDSALTNARRVLEETGCDAVKMEGGAILAPTIAHLVQNNIPVMGHIGLLPQSVIREGGYKVKGKTEEDIARLIDDAKALEQAGAFSLVIEGTIHQAAEQVTGAIGIPTIGIGASAQCDGQILVVDDMLGLTRGRVAKFVKQYARLDQAAEAAIEAYANEVRSRHFPQDAHLYKQA